MQRSDGHEEGIRAVVVQMVVHGRALDAAQVRHEARGIVRVTGGDEFRVDPPEIQIADDAHEEGHQEAGHGGELVEQFVHAAGRDLALAGLLHFAQDPLRDFVDRVGRLGDEVQQRLR